MAGKAVTMKMADKDGLLIGRSVDLRFVDVSDAAFILSLRMDASLSRYLTPVSGQLCEQQVWIRNYKERERQKQEYYFIIQSKTGELFGTVRVYDFKGDSFSWGSWVLRVGSPLYAALDSALMVYCFAFYHLGFKCSHFEVRKENAAVNRFHQCWGATIVRKDDLNIYYKYDEELFRRIKKKYEGRL
jgi:RimJ/RimL family protein N-acetyltransferase